MRRLIALNLLVATLVLPAAAQAGQPYLVSDPTVGNIWRIEDTNADGDALDVGERTLWGTGFASVFGLEIYAETVYAVETGLAAGSNEVVRLIDANHDGDALDLGERIVWADGLDFPRDVFRDADGTFYVTEGVTDEVLRLVDANGDGDALDVGEQTLFADAINKPTTILPWQGGLLVTATNSSEVIRLDDINGDGDATDATEKVVVASGIDSPIGLLDDRNGGFFVSSHDEDTVYHATDNNSDGDFLDVAEVLSYADNVFGGLSGPLDMASYPTGGFLVADSDNDQVKLAHDLNGDGDALDLGEVVLFADGIGLPTDIVALPIGLPGDYNNDGVIDAADYTVWRDALEGGGWLINDPTPLSIDEDDYAYWRANFGMSLGSGAGSGGAAATTVPEPDTLAMLLAGGILALVGRHGRSTVTHT